METHGYFVGMEYEIYQVFPPMNPAHMRFFGAWKGIASPDFTKEFSYCELGCGQGYGLLMLAALYPNGRFHGVDFAASQIARATWLTMETGFTNITFEAASFGDFAAAEGEKYDVIALHGVWSWVGRGAQEQILEVVRKRLKPGGFVYVSANTLSGWAQVAPFQQLMLELKRSMPDAPPQTILKTFKDIYDTNPPILAQSPRAKIIIDKAFAGSASYVAHEYFNEAWRPVTFAEMAVDFGSAGATYVCSGRARDTKEEFRVTDAMRAMMAAHESPAMRETLRDFLTAESFRTDYFAREPRELTIGEQLETIASTTVGVISREACGIKTITGLAVPLEVDTELRDSIAEFLLTNGASTIRDIAATDIATQKGVSATIDTLLLMHLIGAIEFGMGDVEDRVVKERALRFNEVSLLFARTFGGHLQLASPAVRGAVMLPVKDRTYLLAMIEGRDPVTAMLEYAEKAGAEFKDNGKEVTGKAARRQAVAKDYANWQQKQLPELARLGIVGFADSPAESATG